MFVIVFYKDFSACIIFISLAPSQGNLNINVAKAACNLDHLLRGIMSWLKRRDWLKKDLVKQLCELGS